MPKGSPRKRGAKVSKPRTVRSYGTPKPKKPTTEQWFTWRRLRNP